MCIPEVSEFHFTATCPGCGGPLRWCNGVTRAGTESLAVVECEACAQSWSLALYLRPLERFDRGAESKRRVRAKVSV